MKPNIRSLNYGTLYSLTITKLPIEPYSIDTIVITKLNTKIQNKRIIVLKGEKRVYFQFSYTDSIPTIKIETYNYQWLDSADYYGVPFMISQIINSQKVAPFISSSYDVPRKYYGDKNKIFKIISSLPIILYDSSFHINIFNPHFIRVENGMAHHTNWAWKDVKWHVMKELD